MFGGKVERNLVECQSACMGPDGMTFSVVRADIAHLILAMPLLQQPAS